MQTYDVPGPVSVSVDCPVGEVSVATGDEPVARVEVRALRDDETSREAAANTRVELRDGRDLVVEVPRRAGSFFGREPSVRVDVRVPHGSALSFHTSSADVEAAGRYAEVAGKTASGDVRVAGADDVRVESASGDLHVGEVHGAASLKSASGDVSVTRAGGPVVASVVSGDLAIGTAARGGSFSAVSGGIEVGAVAAGDVDVRAVSGDVSLGIAPGTRVHVDVTTVSGDLHSELALDDVPAGDGSGPLVEVRGRTVSGDLRISRAQPVVA